VPFLACQRSALAAPTLLVATVELASKIARTADNPKRFIKGLFMGTQQSENLSGVQTSSGNRGTLSAALWHALRRKYNLKSAFAQVFNLLTRFLKASVRAFAP
jgi:hypothetical protein